MEFARHIDADLVHFHSGVLGIFLGLWGECEVAWQGAEKFGPLRLNRLRKSEISRRVAALSGFYETAVEFKGILMFFYS
jgi:hypothetical protein